jgi:hypothetical protein
MLVLDFPLIQCSVDLLSLTNDEVSPLVSSSSGVKTLVHVFLNTCQRDVCRTLVACDIPRVCYWERQPTVIGGKKTRFAGYERCMFLFRQLVEQEIDPIARLTSMMNKDHHRSVFSSFSESGLV